MANVPNAHRYRTISSSNASVRAASGGRRNHDGGGYPEAGPQAAQFGSSKGASIGVIIVVLGFVVLAVKFPFAILTVCGITAAMLLFEKK